MQVCFPGPSFVVITEAEKPTMSLKDYKKQTLYWQSAVVWKRQTHSTEIHICISSLAISDFLWAVRCTTSTTSTATLSVKCSQQLTNPLNKFDSVKQSEKALTISDFPWESAIDLRCLQTHNISIFQCMNTYCFLSNDIDVYAEL